MTFSEASLASLTHDFAVQSHIVQPGLVRVALARKKAIEADGAILELRFTMLPGAPALSLNDVRLSGLRLNDAAGRDFETSALQKQVVIGPPYQVLLPLIRR